MAERATPEAAPADEAELEERLTTPTELSVRAVRALTGDLLVLGVGGKMGPSLAVLARRSLEAAGLRRRVIGVARFSAPGLEQRLNAAGVETTACDLLDRAALGRLPDAPEVVFMAGMKFGATAAPAQTWAMNCLLPALVAERFRRSRIVAFSTGNLYPFVTPGSGGATEETPPAPVGEYAQSCLGRERMFEYASARDATPVTLLRLNYANDLRYGVMLDIALKVWQGAPVDVSVGWLNAIWQGDANAAALACFGLCASPPAVLNVTGPGVLSVRDLARRFAGLLGKGEPEFTGTEAGTALLSNASRCAALFGPPLVTLDRLVAWTAQWVRSGGPTLAKPTHFEVRDGKF